MCQPVLHNFNSTCMHHCSTVTKTGPQFLPLCTQLSTVALHTCSSFQRTRVGSIPVHRKCARHPSYHSNMVAERQFNGAVQDDLDWLDKNRLTDNDEFIDVPVPQNQEIQTIPSKCISERLLEQIVDVIMPQIQWQIVEVLKILLERVQQRFVEQIADAHAPSVRDTSYRDERTSKVTKKKENLEAYVANMKFDAGVGEDPFARVKGLITETEAHIQA